MKRGKRRRPHLIRLLLTFLGLSLFAFLIWKVGPARVAENIRSLSWGIAVIIAWTGVSHVAKALGWRFAIPRESRKAFSFFQIVQMRMVGEAVSQIVFAGHVFGETAKAMLLKSRIPLQHGVSSVVLDRGMYTFTALGVLVLGGALAPLVSPLRLGGGYVAVLAGVLLVMVVMAASLSRRWRFFSAPFGKLLDWGLLPSGLDRRREKLRELEQLLQDFYHERPRDFWACLGLNMAGQAFSVAEVYLVLYFLGADVGLLTAFLIESFTKLVNLAGAVIPANLGVYEGGNMMILPLLGGTVESGLTLGLARRIRGLFWTGVGLAMLAFFRSNPPSAAAEIGTALERRAQRHPKRFR